MVSRLEVRTFALVLAYCGVAASSQAQALSIEEEKPAAAPPTPAPSAAPLPPRAPPTPPVIVMPKALSTPLEYPDGAKGEATVALELTLTVSGDVTVAVAIEGDEPFTSSAVTAAKAWKFEPAK